MLPEFNRTLPPCFGGSGGNPLEGNIPKGGDVLFGTNETGIIIRGLSML